MTNPERRFGPALAGLNQAQKPGGGVPAYTRWVNRRFARYAAALAYTWGWTPNVVTAVSAVFSFAALLLLVTVEPTLGIGVVVALLLALGYLLDSADGQVARLSGKGSKQGEWLDHVVDAIRTPAIHIAVAVGFWRWSDEILWPIAIALVYALVSVGQFMSQILAEQLSAGEGRPTQTGGVAQSFVLIPTDMGTLCLIFLTWGSPTLFLVVYCAMFVLNTAHSAISMRRKYIRLASVARPAPTKVTTN